MNNVGISYILWAGIFFGLGGLHRLYNGKIFSGLLWLFTGGLLGIGQLIDLFFMPDMVESHNLKFQRRHGLLTPEAFPRRSIPAESIHPKQAPLSREQLRIKLLKTAQAKGGQLSVTQGVMATGAPFKAVEAVLQDMLKAGYVGISNDPGTGVVVYVFKEL